METRPRTQCELCFKHVRKASQLPDHMLVKHSEKEKEKETPTLGFCVRRHDDIQSFKPKSYWLIQLKLSTGPVDDPIEMKTEWDRGRIFDREVAQMFLNRVKSEKECNVVDVSKNVEGAKQRPLALNTVEMMRVASSGLGMSPRNVMQIAERLYTEGYISYHWTKTTQYPANFDFKSALRQQQNNPSWGSIVAELLKNGYTKPRNGDEKGDYPPITPIKPNDGRLSGDHKRLYDFITQNFIGSLMPNCRFWINTIKTEMAGETFSISGKTLIDPGYTAVVTWQALAPDSTMPSLSPGQTLRIDEAKLVERQTGPPDYLTEAELITLMEKHGIGTNAFIPVHINNIGQRNYAELHTSGDTANQGLDVSHQSNVTTEQSVGIYTIELPTTLPSENNVTEPVREQEVEKVANQNKSTKQHEKTATGTSTCHNLYGRVLYNENVKIKKEKKAIEAAASRKKAPNLNFQGKEKDVRFPNVVGRPLHCAPRWKDVTGFPEECEKCGCNDTISLCYQRYHKCYRFRCAPCKLWYGKATKEEKKRTKKLNTKSKMYGNGVVSKGQNLMSKRKKLVSTDNLIQDQLAKRASSKTSEIDKMAFEMLKKEFVQTRSLLNNACYINRALLKKIKEIKKTNKRKERRVLGDIQRAASSPDVSPMKLDSQMKVDAATQTPERMDDNSK